MQTGTIQTLQHYLGIYDLTVEEFATISGMPVAETNGILRDQLRMTRLRACHLAAVFENDIAFGMNLKDNANKKVQQNPKAH